MFGIDHLERGVVARIAKIGEETQAPPVAEATSDRIEEPRRIIAYKKIVCWRSECVAISRNRSVIARRSLLAA